MERRSTVRSRAVLRAEIRYNDGLMSVPCLVRDISDSGARLEVSPDIPLPDRFNLFIEKKHLTRPAVVRRRRETEVGVVFADHAVAPPPPPAPAVDDGLAARVAKLEADAAEMRKLLGQIAGALQRLG